MYMVMTKHPIFGEIVVDITPDKWIAEQIADDPQYGECWIEEMAHESGEVQE